MRLYNQKILADLKVNFRFLRDKITYQNRSLKTRTKITKTIATTTHWILMIIIIIIIFFNNNNTYIKINTNTILYIYYYYIKIIWIIIGSKRKITKTKTKNIFILLRMIPTIQLVDSTFVWNFCHAIFA